MTGEILRDTGKTKSYDHDFELKRNPFEYDKLRNKKPETIGL